MAAQKPPKLSSTKEKKGEPKTWQLRLYVAGQTPKSIAAFANLKKICEEHIEDKCAIEVVDILENPDIARQEQIVAVPTLMKLSPKPERVLVGDFSKTDQVLKGLDVERWAHG